jgi:hypothetical protein
MKIQRLRSGRTVAVIGSIAVIGGGATAVAATRDGEHTHNAAAARSGLAPSGPRKPLASLSTAELAALAKARAAIAAAAPGIVDPILEKAVSAGTITSSQRSQFLAELSASPGPGAGRDGIWSGATGATGSTAPAKPPALSGATGAAGATVPTPAGAAAEAVFASARQALQAKVSSIATPVLEAAVSDSTITATQEQTLLGLLESGPGPGGAGGAPGAMPDGRPGSAGAPGYAPAA